MPKDIFLLWITNNATLIASDMITEERDEGRKTNLSSVQHATLFVLCLKCKVQRQSINWKKKKIDLSCNYKLAQVQNCSWSVWHMLLPIFLVASKQNEDNFNRIFYFIPMNSYHLAEIRRLIAFFIFKQIYRFYRD